MFIATRHTFGSLLIDAHVPGAFIALAPLHKMDRVFTLSSPVFEVDGKERGKFLLRYVAGQRTLPGGWEDLELSFIAAGDEAQGEPDLYLRVTFRRYFKSPFIRMRYRLTAAAPCKLTRSGGSDHLCYFGLELAEEQADGFAEITLSQFEPVLHSYQPGIEFIALTDTFPGQKFPGPVIALESGDTSFLMAYEHGADYPDAYLGYTLHPVENRYRLALDAWKGNYLDGQEIGPERAFESVWFDFGLVDGGLGDLLPRFRQFLLDEINPSPGSRKPVIGYNTWNYQERNKLYRGRPYLESMNLERMLAEVDAAHRLGIDLFVIDTGWFDRPGDWGVNMQRFPDGLKEVKRRLDGYGMQLGLWFNPLAAGLNAQIYREHPEYEMSWQGKAHDHWVVWETEESTAMCLVSGYADYFADVMLRFREELGVTYFKWDGVGQQGCDSPLHEHGDQAHSPEERADSYAYQMGLRMLKIVEKVTARYPDVFVDFDITECGRFVGLGFLSAGRYFLINNGSYAKDFDTAESLGINPWMNMFFYPGAARARVCRRAAHFDTVVPASLMMVHYLPDGPQLSLDNNLASLVLGGNALWGDLPALSEEQVRFWSENIASYKRVIKDVARAYPITRGVVGSSPEIHEKIDPQTSAGVVSFFTTAPGEFHHLTQPVNLEKLGEVKGADAWELTHDGRLKLTVRLERDGARAVFLLPK